MTLTEFLLARINEDVELVRQLTTGEHAEPSRWSESRGDIYGEMSPWWSRRIALLDGGNRVSSLAGEHIARWDPSRVLAECEAKRRIIALDECVACGTEVVACDHRDSTMRLLALPYADHPDYDATWRP